ncbi:MAG: ABC transporter ATP-binding protein [Beijerinckiaceae bacterium]
MAEIAIDNITVSYGGNRVIESLSLEIADQSFFTLLGPSGCGKTTLLRTLAGFLPVDQGVIRFGDTDVTRIPAHKRDIGMVFQDYALFPDKTVFENVAYGLRARKRDEADIRKAVPEYLERVGLTGLDQRRPADLSGGQRQRVALARALVIKPKVLLMDEPLSNLDAKLRVQVRETIADLQRAAGITTVFVTHDQEEALALSDQIGLMRQGRIAQKGTPQDIYGAPVSAYVADFVGAANVVAVALSGWVGAGQRTTLRLGHVDIQAIAASDLDAGEAHVLMRPEDIVLSATARPGSHPAVVMRRQYLGSRTHYRIRLGDNGVMLAVDRAGPDHAQFLSGDAVHVWLDPALTRVVAA